MIDRPFIPMAECVDHAVYRVRTRNLDPFCVYDARKRGFVGIRTKFTERFLDVEYHHEASSRHGTARPSERVDAVVPVGLPLDEYLGTWCRTCHEPVEWSGQKKPDGSIVAPAPWVHVGVADHGEDHGALPQVIENEALFNWLDSIQPKETTP